MDNSEPLSNTERLRLYQRDIEDLDALKKQTGLTRQELIRRAVNAGVTVIADQLRPLIELNKIPRKQRTTK